MKQMLVSSWKRSRKVSNGRTNKNQNRVFSLLLLLVLVLVTTSCASQGGGRKPITIHDIPPFTSSTNTIKFYEKKDLDSVTRSGELLDDQTKVLKTLKVEVLENGEEVVILHKNHLQALAIVLEDRRYSKEYLKNLIEDYNNLVDLLNQYQLKVVILENSAEALRQFALLENDLKEEYKEELRFEKIRTALTSILSIIAVGLMLF